MPGSVWFVKDCIQCVPEETLRGSHSRSEETIDIFLAITRFCRIDVVNREAIRCLKQCLKTLPINDDNVPRVLPFESNMQDSNAHPLETFQDGWSVGGCLVRREADNPQRSCRGAAKAVCRDMRKQDDALVDGEVNKPDSIGIGTQYLTSSSKL